MGTVSPTTAQRDPIEEEFALEPDGDIFEDFDSEPQVVSTKATPGLAGRIMRFVRDACCCKR